MPGPGEPVEAVRISVVGLPNANRRGVNAMKSERFARQSFLGEARQAAIERCVVGLVGLGGAGSHIVQQLAHVGFLNYVLYDADFRQRVKPEPDE